MKSFFSLLLFISVSLSLPAASATVYQCPMHPWIKSDKPGDKCTLCGMELVAAPAGDAAADPNLVTLTPASASVVGVQTSPVARGPLVRTLRVAGVVEDDDARHRILSARVPGRVEKLFVNFVGAEVREGEPLATVYSPEMLTAQRQYVERLRGGSAFPVAERAAAREKMLDLGLTEEEINILEHTLEPTAMVNLRAPMSGTVVSRNIYEGQQLNKGSSESESRLFEIADFSSMWFVFDAYEPDLAWLRVGQSVDITVPSLPGQVLTAPIAFIDPNLNATTRTAKVRVVLPNRDHRLLHQQTGYARVRAEIPDVLLAPRSAVLQHGAEPIVFLQSHDRAYLARRVKTGRVGDESVEIISGLNAGDRVVTEGGLVLDGQAQLARAAITGDASAHQHAGMAMPAAPAPASAPVAELKSLALVLADAASALAKDDVEGYKQQLPALRNTLAAYLAKPVHESLDKFQKSLREPADLRTARRDFEPFSTAVADLLRALPAAERKDLHIFQCPMAPVLGTGRWVSRTGDLKNPFFGSSMLECGEELN